MPEHAVMGGSAPRVQGALRNIAEPVTVYQVVFDDKAAALVTPVAQEATKSADRPWVVPAAVAVVLMAAVGGVLWWRPWAPDVG